MTTKQQSQIGTYAKLGATLIAGVGLGAALLGLPKCSDLQTVVNADLEHAVIEKRVEAANKEIKEEIKEVDQRLEKTIEAVNSNASQIKVLIDRDRRRR